MQQGQHVTIKEASLWASNLLKRQITTSNISYLIQYGKVRKYGNNGSTMVDLKDLNNYYQSFKGYREIAWKEKLGNDLNWVLSFDNLRETDTTKHVHRLHPYKGKFIPQLVEYFLDNHIDNFKTEMYFKKGDIVLDPFAGSGTTLVQANELDIHAIGIDISRFNSLITEVKLLDYEFDSLKKEIKNITASVLSYEVDNLMRDFENELIRELSNFNNKFFPGYNFKYQLQQQKINETEFAKEKEKEFLDIYEKLVKKYNVRLKQNLDRTFLDKWYLETVRKEIEYAFALIRKIKDIKNKKILAIILSRTIRSCRATTHSDLATLVEPQVTTYYCYKHKKICKPIFSIKAMFLRYANDSLERIQAFSLLKTKAFSLPITADSRNVKIDEEIKKKSLEFYELYSKKKIKGIFSSPPYVGQIDYHEQHAYAYTLMGFERKDELEIGPLSKGQGLEARNLYINGISSVLLNCRKYLDDDFNIFLVANDKYNLYPTIAEKSDMKIVNTFKRPVLNRTERDRSPYSEIIFHIK